MLYAFDPVYLGIMVVGLVLGLLTQGWIRGSYRKWSRVPLMNGRSGAEVARAMLDENGLRGVPIEQIAGKLTDHYDPRARVLRLSADVYAGRSVASAGVAAHEAGHAIQHALAYGPAAVRQTLVPAANIGSQMSWLLMALGFYLQSNELVLAGALVFGAAVLFQLVTLPVEFDASRRAVATLSNGLPPDQAAGARSVLNAAAMTYVAAALVSILQFVYFLGLSRRD
jgi:Zn-dependent membrane protease YugP